MIIDRLSILDAIKTFRNVIDNVPIEVEVLDRSENGSYFVNLFATHETFVCVNDFLLYHKIAIPIDDCRTLRVGFEFVYRKKNTKDFSSQKKSIHVLVNHSKLLFMNFIFKASK